MRNQALLDYLAANIRRDISPDRPGAGNDISTFYTEQLNYQFTFI